MEANAITGAGRDLTCHKHRALRSRMRLLVSALAFTTCTAIAQVGSGPVAKPLPPALPAPQDRAYNGTIGLDVKAVDTEHQVFSVHETMPVQQAGDAVLLYPHWETASHAPTASIADLAGLMVYVDGVHVDWTRDPVDMYAFHIGRAKGRAHDHVGLPISCGVQRTSTASGYGRAAVAARAALSGGMVRTRFTDCGHAGAA